MAKIKKKYSFTNNRQIWRLVPTNSDKIIIEDRDIIKKEVFFSCLDINTGEVFFSSLQLQEKFWTGIEAVYKDIIYFHNFSKPGLPVHTGIIAFDINSKKIIWKTDDYNYFFAKDDEIYVYKNKFEGKEFASLDHRTGEKLEELRIDIKSINILREEESDRKFLKRYVFPKLFDLNSDYTFSDIINELNTQRSISGLINYIELNNLLFINFHETLSNGNFRNIIRIIEIDSRKIILEEILDRETKLLIPESFFIIKNLVFLIKEKIKLLVYSF
ncbi:MAG: DUF4905 domain-containing protein [Candidatus Thorarchaeota archaeon]